MILVTSQISLAAETPSAVSDIAQVELMQPPAPAPLTPSQQPAEGSRSYWDRITGAASSAVEGLLARGRTLGYTGARLTGIGTDVKSEVRAQLKRPELARYFPDEKEIEAIVQQIDERVRKEALNGIVTDQKAIRAFEIALTETSSRVMDRILETEGVRDEARRREWQTRLLAPIRSCIASASVYLQATDCRTAFQPILFANLAVAATYETARTELQGLPGNPALDTAKAVKATLERCQSEGTDPTRNAECLHQIARTGLHEIATRKIDSLVPPAIQEQHPQLRPQLVEHLLQCVDNETTRPSRPQGTGILDHCKRDTVLRAGSRIDETVIPMEIDSFIQRKGGLAALNMTQADRNKLVETIREAQQKCLTRDQAGTSTETLLDQCLRDSIQNIALSLGTKVLNQRARKHLNADVDETLRKEFENDLSTCMSGFTLRNYRSSIDGCETRLTRDYTVKIARQALGKTLQDRLPGDPEGQRLIAEGLERRLAEMSRAKDLNDLDQKVDALQSEATYEIATRALSQVAKEQLNTDRLPREFTDHDKDLKEELKQCLAKKELTPEACARRYAIAMIKKLGSLALKKQIADLRRSRGVNPGPTLQPELESYFNQCVDKIETPELNDTFKEGVEKCVAQMGRRAVFLVTRNQVMPSVTAQTNSRQTQKKTEEVLQEAVDCLSKLNGFNLTSPNGNGNISSLLKFLRDFFAYDPTTANRTLEAALKDVREDLANYGSAAAQERLLKSMAENGVVDQLIKAAVRDQVREGLASLKPSERPSEQLRNRLTDPDNLDKIFTPAVLARLRPMFIEKILKPTLLQGQSLTSSSVAQAKNAMKRDISAVLARSPNFGQVLADASIQKSLDQVGMRWSEVQDSPEKRRARAYIQNYLVYPRIAGQSLRPNEEARRLQIATEHVTKAVVNPTPIRRSVARDKTTCRFSGSELVCDSNAN